MGVVRRSADLADMLSALLTADPLSVQEKKIGRALRIAGCFRANDRNIEEKPSGFVWSIVAFSRDGVAQAPALAKLSGVLSRLLGARPAPRFCARGSIAIAGEPWDAFEYEIFVPRQLLAFSLHLDGATCSVSRHERNAMVNSHFLDIRNAYADEEGYAWWLQAHRAETDRLIKAPGAGPLLSIVVPVFRTPPVYLEQLIESVLKQTYGRWELVLVNASPDDTGVATVISRYDGDERIRVIDHPVNDGIAGNTNVGIAAAKGDYVSFLDHDDFLEPQALAAIADAVLADPDVDLLYCDEDTFDNGRFRVPLFKPPLNWDFLYSNNYVIHFLTVSRRALAVTERSDSGVDGAQDYDLTFKVLEQGGGVVRIPRVLYHWRMHSGSTNANAQAKPWAQEAGRLAIERHLARRGIQARVQRAKTDSTYQVDFLLPSSAPSLLCVVMGAEISHETADAIGRYGDVCDARVAIDVAGPRADGQGLVESLRRAAGTWDAVLVIRPDVVLDYGSLEKMIGHLARPEVFSIVPRVLRQDGLVESAGCLAVSDGSIVKLGKGLPACDEAYLGRSVRSYDHAVVTDDVCLFKGGLLDVLSGVSSFRTVLYAMNSLCMEAYGDGKANVYCPYAEARIVGPRTLLAQWGEIDDVDRGLFAARYAGVLESGDPTHDPNFDPKSPYYRLDYSGIHD